MGRAGIGISLGPNVGIGPMGSGAASYSSYALALDYLNRKYRSGSQFVSGDNAVSLLPGYTYTRSGPKSELNASTGLTSFAANVPGIVPGVGYWSRGAMTNEHISNNAPSWGASGTGTVGSTSVGTGALGSNVVTINNLGASSGANSSAGIGTTAVSAGATKTVYALVRGTGSDIGKTTRAACTRNGAGTFEQSFGSDVVLTSDWQLAKATITFVNAQTGYRIDIVGGASNSASSVEVCLPHGVTGTQPGPIIVTTGATVTVGADVLPVTFNPGSEYTLICHFKTSETGIAVSVDDGTSNNRAQIGASANTLSYGVASGGVTEFFNTAAVATTSGVKVAMRVKANDFAIYSGGVQRHTDAVFAVPTTTRVAVGMDRLNASQLQGTVEFIGIIARGLTNAELASVTS